MQILHRNFLLKQKLRDELEQKTHACIESLTDEDAYKLLGQKWIMPLCKKIFALPAELLDAIERDVTKLTKRYADTLLSVGTEIEKAENIVAVVNSNECALPEDVEGDCYYVVTALDRANNESDACKPLKVKAVKK